MATLDEILTPDESATQLGLEGIVLPAQAQAAIDRQRGQAVADLERRSHFNLLDDQKTLIGTVSGKYFSRAIPDFVKDIHGFAYRREEDTGADWKGGILPDELKLEPQVWYSARGKKPTRMYFLAVTDEWPEDMAQGREAVLTINTGLAIADFDRHLPRQWKQYALMRLSGYYEDHVIVRRPGRGLYARPAALDHELAERIGDEAFGPPVPERTRLSRRRR